MDLRDMLGEPEYTTKILGMTVDIWKMGGGTLGRSYDGKWGYKVTSPNGRVIAEGDDLNTGTPKTHREAARIAVDFLD